MDVEEVPAPYPEFGFNALREYQPKKAGINVTFVPIDFCREAADNAGSDLCYKHGQGLLYCNSTKGAWNEDIGSSKLLNYMHCRRVMGG